MNGSLFKKRFDKIADNVNSVIHGKDDVVRLALVAACANGHVLFEDVPGVGKSMLARALGISMGCGTNRIQCTPDMLPGDITGSSVIDQSGGRMKFVFKPGPVFTNILLVDEINRSTPKTQSALLEAMRAQPVQSQFLAAVSRASLRTPYEPAMPNVRVLRFPRPVAAMRRWTRRRLRALRVLVASVPRPRRRMSV